MPEVPKYTQQTVAPRSAGLPTNYAREATPAAFGALTGQAISNFGNDLNNLSQEAGDVVIKRNMENIQRYSKQYASEYDAYKNKLLAGDGTPNNPGVMNLKGENAIQAYNPTVDALKKKREEIAGRTDNQYIGDAFNAYADQADNLAHEQLGMHVASERLAANKDASDGRIDSAFSDASTYWRDDKTMNSAFLTVDEEVRQQGEAAGLSKDAIDNNVKRAVSKLTAARIEAGLSVNTQEAKKLFNKFGDDLDGQTSSKLRDKIDDKEKSDIRDYFSMESHQHEQLLQFHENNFTKLVGDVMGGSKSSLDVKNAVDHNQIDGQQGENLLNLIVSPKGKGNPKRANELYVKLATGEANIYDVANDQSISEDERTPLIGKAIASADRGSVFAREDVKFNADQIDKALRGGKGALADLDQDTAYRMRGAVQQYHDAVAKSDPLQINKNMLDEFRDDAIKAWGVGSANDPLAIINRLPLPITWQGERGGTKEDLTKRYDASFAQLLHAHDSGLIDEQRASEEVNRFKALKEQIDRIPVRVAPK